MRTLAILAGKEFRDGLRNRWVFATIVLLTALALALTLLGSAPVGEIKASRLSATVASLSSLSVYLLPLIALMLSYNALVGEFERGTMILLLTYPVARWQVVVGKFLGHMAILTVAIVVGYGVSALYIHFSGGGDAQGWRAFSALIGSSVLLGAVFIALGYLLSQLAREESMAAGLAIGTWIVMVVLYDLALLGMLVADHGEGVGKSLFSWLLLFNPTDAYRIFNLTTFNSVTLASGMAGVGLKVGLGAGTSLLTMLVWLAASLGGCVYLFHRREL
ncbi:ABC transporter permease subunit [Varunaivibrio sulfuroxidans]|uniref:Cu-processing system permease protein n=1 Tax=Varunaivibrio sulfuroxidans TaxID=1773489 RepID=A0A4V2UNZ6_9PROT|nr:ABC transporter permease subunit [Varunaivibrio sulfuroxidans]TCS63991.1 Cu-processing system permease protein [Varunaivibrio sulfuroxidans]WES31556.1 ABC transporter permease subunit [Varunaivibrio sulfuroxidans]